jgi:hypothetical protein
MAMLDQVPDLIRDLTLRDRGTPPFCRRRLKPAGDFSQPRPAPPGKPLLGGA